MTHNPKTISHPSGADIEEILNPSSADTRLIDLDHLQLVRVTGEDAENFTQAQFSNDVSELDNERAQLQGYCNPKGRALAILRLLRHHEHGFWMLVPVSIAEPLLKRLQMFVLRAKVKFEVEQDYTALGLLGPLPAGAENGDIYQVEGHIERKVGIFPNSQLPGAQANTDVCLHHDFWKLIDILSGIPQVYQATSEAFIPQNINLELVNGVSFRKGCFPGQEIVARLKYLGKSKQRLAIASVESSKIVQPGDEIFSEHRPDQKAGMVVDAVEIDNSTYQASVMIPAVQPSSGAMHIGSVSGPALELQPLPYSIPAE